jgi:transcriptional regulator of heat shock response
MILSEFLNPLTNQVEVIIAGEGRWEAVSRLSFVLSRYGEPGKLSGAVGVLGPTHINYGRAIGAVRHVSAIMTDLVARLYEPSAPDAAGQDDIDTPDSDKG